jgi:hypothetical protein
MKEDKEEKNALLGQKKVKNKKRKILKGRE